MTDEIRKYLANEQQNHPEYFQALIGVMEQVESAAPGTSVFVLIPVHASEQNIGGLLRLYGGQTIDSGVFEIVLFLNRKNDDVSFDALRQQIHEFQRGNSLRVRYFEWTFSQRAPIGLLRKILNDVVLLRGATAECLLVNNDADALGIRPEYIEDLIGLHRGKEVLSTQSQHYADEAYAIPHFGDLLRLIESLEGSYGPDAPQGAFVSAWCGNTVLNAASYVRVGGFNSSAWVGEELVLVFSFVKKFGMQSFFRTTPHIVTSCRRIAHGFLNNIRAVQAYSDFFTADIRNTSEMEILDSLRYAVRMGTAPSVTKRAAEEFEFYLRKLAITPETSLTDTREKRFILCQRVFSAMCKELKMTLQVREEDTRWRVSFVDARDSREVVIQK